MKTNKIIKIIGLASLIFSLNINCSFYSKLKYFCLCSQIQLNRYLLEACQSGNLNQYKLLIKNGADINAINEYGNTPLNLACEHGHIEICTLLIENGASLNVVDLDDKTPLHWAAKNGRLMICELILNSAQIVKSRNFEILV